MGIVVCATHPDETPLPGICPSCLRERLFRLIAVKHSKLTYAISSSSPSVSASPLYFYDYSPSPASSSGGYSPPHRRHQRVASDIMDSIYLAMGGNNGLEKSRSMANYALRNDDHAVNHKKKGGFWKKLLLIRSTGKKKAKLW